MGLYLKGSLWCRLICDWWVGLYDSHDKLSKIDHGSRLLMARSSLYTFQLLAQQGSIRDDYKIHYTHLFSSSRSAFGGDAKQLAAADDLGWILEAKKNPSIVSWYRDRWQIVRKYGRMKATVALARGFDRAYLGSVTEQRSFQRPSASSFYKNGLCCTRFWKEYCLDWSRVQAYVSWVHVMWQLSYDISYDELMEQQPDGVFYPVGLAIPIRWKRTLPLDQKLNGQIPIWGMGGSAGGSSLQRLSLMEVGHFGLNIPVREIATGKIEITSQRKSLV